jgi:hypothetical protein
MRRAGLRRVEEGALVGDGETVSVTAGAGISFPSCNSGYHNGGPTVRTSGGTSRGGGRSPGWKNGGCHGWMSGGGMVWPAVVGRKRSGPESGQNAWLGRH